VRLALRVARRYARRPRFLGPLERVFLRPRVRLAVHHRHDRSVERVTVAPRLHVTIAGRHVTRPAAVRLHASARAPVSRHSVVVRSQSSQLVERIERRSTRVERVYFPAVAAVAPDAAPAGPVAHRVPAAPVYLRRLAPAPAQAPDRPGPAQPSAARPAEPPSAGPSGPELDVTRLTDRVLTAIDARLLAERERLGRP
jgi:hypothetical protein